MDNKILFSELFSYWIFIWFILYYILFMNKEKIKTIVNPIPVFIFALFENFIMLLIMIFLYKPFSSIIIYTIVVFFLKLIPLYILRNEKISWLKNLLFTFLVFVVYNLYLNYKKTNIYEIYNKTMDSLLENKGLTPGYALLTSIFEIV